MDDDLVARPAVDFEAVFESSTSPYAVLDTAMTFVAVNDAYCAVAGRPRDRLLGRSLFDAFPDNPDEEADGSTGPMRASLRAAMRTGEPDVMGIHRYDVADEATGEYVERFWSITNSPVVGPAGDVAALLVHAEEVTTFIDQRLRDFAGGGARRATSQQQAIDTAFTRAMSHLGRLNDLTAALVGATTLDEVARALMRDGLVVCDARGGAVVTVSNNHYRIFDHQGIDPAVVDTWSRFRNRPGIDPVSDVVTHGEALFFESRSAFVERYPALADIVESSTSQAWAVLPLRDGESITGALALVFDAPNRFGVAERLALYSVAGLASQSIARAQTMGEQSSTLTSLDEALLQPHPDVVAGLAIRGIYRPATRSATAGGDWYDVIEVSPEQVLVVVGDVADHGVAAVGEMGRARSTVQTVSIGRRDPADIADAASIALDRFSTTITTAFIATIDPATRELRWTTAGHPLPLLVSADGTISFLEGTHGPPLGVVIDGTGYRSDRRTLEAGDELVVFTDGLIETRGETFDSSMDNLRHTAMLAHGSEDLPARLYRTLHPTGRHEDDIAILSIRIEP